MKKLPAIIAALVTTGIIAVIMVLIGANAILYPNQVAAASSPNNPQAAVSNAPAGDQLQQAQDLIAQYQAREKQYQQREQQYQNQINQLEQRVNQDETQLQQASTAVQQYQGVLQELVNRGIIQIDRRGDIFLGGGENESH